MANSNTPSLVPPSNALVGEHPVDTLMQIQSVIAFLQQYTTQAADHPDMSPYHSLVNTGHHSILQLLQDALDYEIDRLDQLTVLRVLK